MKKTSRLLLMAALVLLMAVLVFAAPPQTKEAFGADFTESSVTFTDPQGGRVTVRCADITLLAVETAPEYPQALRLPDGRLFGRLTHAAYGECTVYGYAQAQSAVVLGTADGRVFLFSCETERETQAYYKALHKYTHVKPPATAVPEA